MIFCPSCESQDVTVTRVSVDASRFGLPSGRVSGVERIECQECGEATINLPAQGAVIKEYRRQLAHLGRDLSSAEFAFLRRSLGMSGLAYAEAAGISNVTVSRLENGDDVPALQQGLVRALTLLDLSSIDSFKQFVTREGVEVDVDVAAVERGQPHDISNGWQDLPSHKSLGSNVLIFRHPSRTRAIQTVEFSSSGPAYELRASCP